jgi:hypothetical protein
MNKFTTSLKQNLSLSEVPGEESDTPSPEETGDYISVALLDDGVDPEWEGLGKFMSGQGWPQPSESAGHGGPSAPFYSSGREQHGNRMATLITMVCPFVRLYVAKMSPEAGAAAGVSQTTFDAVDAIEVRGLSSWFSPGFSSMLIKPYG